jgi:hypothetical protein
MSPSGNERKERVIHTRVPESLDDEIKRKASDLGLSVSNLVRNVLQNAFGLVGTIVHDSAEIARSARDFGGRATDPSRAARGEDPDGDTGADGGSRPTPRPRPGRVLGWQEAVLAVNAVCDSCNAILPRGTRAAIGIVEGGAAVPLRCLACLKEPSDEPQQPGG